MGTTKNEKEEQIKQSQLDLYWRFESANNLLHLVIDRDYDYFHKLLEDRLTQAIKNSKIIGDVTLRVKPYDFVSKGWNKHILHDYEIVSSIETIISLIAQGIIGPKGKEREEWITNSRLGIETPLIQMPKRANVTLYWRITNDECLYLQIDSFDETFQLNLLNELKLNRVMLFGDYQFMFSSLEPGFDEKYWGKVEVEGANQEMLIDLIIRYIHSEIKPQLPQTFKNKKEEENPLIDLKESYQQTMKILKEKREESALDVQIGGSHYKQYKIQPIEFIHANEIPYIEASCIKYLCRHRNKNGAEDLRKVIHYCELLLELEYKEKK